MCQLSCVSFCTPAASPAQVGPAVGAVKQGDTHGRIMWSCNYFFHRLHLSSGCLRMWNSNASRIQSGFCLSKPEASDGFLLFGWHSDQHLHCLQLWIALTHSFMMRGMHYKLARDTLAFLLIYSLNLSVFVVATTLSFDGTQFMKILLPEESTTMVEDISLRFRTRRPDGLLFATTSSKSTDRLELMLQGGRVRFDVNLGSGSRVSKQFYCS